MRHLQVEKRRDRCSPEPQPTATVQSGLIGHLIQSGPEHKLLDVFIGKWMNEGQNGPQFLHNHCSYSPYRYDSYPNDGPILSESPVDRDVSSDYTSQCK